MYYMIIYLLFFLGTTIVVGQGLPVSQIDMDQLSQALIIFNFQTEVPTKW